MASGRGKFTRKKKQKGYIYRQFNHLTDAIKLYGD